MEPSILTTETSQILNMMGISYKDISFYFDADVQIAIISLRVSGTEEELFIEYHNALSRDLSKILSLLFQKKYHYYKDIVLDVNGKNKKFIDQAKQKAEIALERVRFFDKSYEFGYLNAYERMLIHSYLKKEQDILTESQGEGKDRRLVIKKK